MKRILPLLFVISLLAVGCKRGAEPLPVISFNVRLGVADDGDHSWVYRREAAAAMIGDQAPAVFGVQEAYDFQLSFIADRCPGYACVGVGREDGLSQGEHMAVFYDTERIELKDWGTYWLSETPDEPSLGWDAACKRTATWTLLYDRKAGRHFYFVNTHLDHVGKEARREGLALIVSRIGAMNPEGYPMVLVGDFNVFPDDPCLKDLRGMMEDAWESAATVDDGPTWHNWGRVTDRPHIDYVFYSGFSSCESMTRITGVYLDCPFVSDHYPVKAVLRY